MATDSTAAPRDRAAGTPRRRVFFALQPDRATTAALARLAEQLLPAGRGRPVPADKLHVTVAFLGSVDAPSLRRARQVPPIAVGAFRLCLDRVGFFRRTGTVWLGPSTVPEALDALYERLWSGLAAAGFERERRPFRPHLTIARRSRAVRRSVDGVCWDVDSLTLMESVATKDAGARYRPLRRWPL